jgi:hypothetical protein
MCPIGEKNGDSGGIFGWAGKPRWFSLREGVQRTKYGLFSLARTARGLVLPENGTFFCCAR